MSKTTTQTQMVSQFLTQKQLDSFKVMNNGVELGKVILAHQRKNEEYFESTSGFDDFYFILSYNKDILTITVGCIVTFSESKYILHIDIEEGLDSDVVSLIKSNIKNMCKYLGNSTSIK
jgi:hypothetical protein